MIGACGGRVAVYEPPHRKRSLCDVEIAAAALKVVATTRSDRDLPAIALAQAPRSKIAGPAGLCRAPTPSHAAGVRWLGAKAFGLAVMRPFHSTNSHGLGTF